MRAAKRQGIEFSSSSSSTTTHIVGPTERVLQLIASRRLVTTTTTTTTAAAITTPCQILAGSATASRKTLDRLNHALYEAATAASSTLETVWDANVQRVDPTAPPAALVTPTNPTSSTGTNNNANTTNDDAENPPAPAPHTHTIRAVTVPPQVTHRYVRLDKQAAQSPLAVLTAVAQATQVLHSKRALLFLCGEFRQAQHAVAQHTSAKRLPRPTAAQQQQRGPKKRSLQQKKKRAIAQAAAASHARRQATGLSARKACAVLHDLGVKAQPLHVVLGLEQDHRHPEATAEEDQDDDADDALPPVLVTFENSARGLHLEDIDTVFVVGRPSSAASYLHLAGRVGRYSSGGIRPGHVISFCTKGSATELTKWTKQVGGTDLEELSLV